MRMNINFDCYQFVVEKFKSTLFKCYEVRCGDLGEPFATCDSIHKALDECIKLNNSKLAKEAEAIMNMVIE